MEYFILALSMIQVLSAQRLESYYVDLNGISTSGLSAGGAMAPQFHVAHSASVMGSATFAGVVYRCAEGDLSTALNCMYLPSFTNVNKMITDAEDYEKDGLIDPTSNLQGANIYIWHGTMDFTVNIGQVNKIRNFYDHFGSNIEEREHSMAGHAQPTVNYGNGCRSSSEPWINACDFDGAYHALNYIYGGNIVEPIGSVELTGQFLEFDQTEFEGGRHFDDIGYVYIPSACVEGEITEPDPCLKLDTVRKLQAGCRLHVVFHGCKQGRERLDDEFARNAGYLEVAELNNIIMLFPQAISSTLANPNGCFDWWAYEDNDYANKNGVQIQAVKAMVDRLAGQN